MMLSAQHSNMAEVNSEEWNTLRYSSAADLSNFSEQLDETDQNVLRKDDDALAQRRKTLEKRVSFPSDETMLVQNLEPAVPDVPECSLLEETGFNLINTYTLSCRKNETEPVQQIIEQLKGLDLKRPRSTNLSLRGLTLHSRDCESLEEVLKNIPLKLFDLGDCHSTDEGLIALFDMIEFYEAATHVSIASNKNMSSRGWQACCRMIKRTECLEWLDAAQVGLSEHCSTLLARALRSNSRLRVLFLNECALAGRSLAIIACSLKMNRNLRELHLAQNKLTPFDALQLGILLSGNASLQLIDLRNNEILDKGMEYICDALLENPGLNSLVVWNNGITQESASAVAKVLATNGTLQTLNLGHNKLGDAGVIGLIASGLERNRSLLHLGLQENGITCTGVIALAESLGCGTQLQRVDLRKNNFELAGLMALAAAMKHCPSITRLDLDVTSNEHAEEYERLLNDITNHCSANKLTAESVVAQQFAEKPADDLISRKISLTCPIPPSDRLLLSLAHTSEEDESQEERVTPRKLRSPLPSPSPSPLPSPTGRFRVTRVDAEESPLPSPASTISPSPRKRFTVTPVKLEFDPAENAGASVGDNKESISLIRSSPSKVIVGFDVLST